MKITILRTDGSDVDQRQYNSQEIGLARGLANQGHAVDIITASDCFETAPIEVIAEGPNNRIAIIRTGYRRIPVLQYGVLTGLRRLLRAGQYDLVHVSEENNPATTMVAFHCRQLDIPYVIYHGMYVVPSGRARTWYDAFHSRIMARDFLQSRGVSEVEVLPVGLDTTRFETMAESTPDNSMLSGLRPRYSRILLYVGRLERRRNPLLLLDIAAAMRDDTALILVGDGPMRDAVSARIDELDLENVVMTGPLGQEELPAVYRQSNAFLLASDYEIYGMVLLEALYFGVPCVTTKTAGGVDIIGANHAGTVVDGYCLEEWVEAIHRASRIGEEKNIQKRLRKLVDSEFSWNHIAKQYLAYVNL